MSEDDDKIPTPTLSTGQPSTLGAWRDLTAATFGEMSAATRYLDVKIDQSARRRDEAVLADERQFLNVLVAEHFRGQGKPTSRTDPDLAYAAFMSMPQSEWLGLVMSLLGGGVLQPAEQVGFDRALRDRKLPANDADQSERGR